MIPPDVPGVRIPHPGEHVTVYGAWVIDKASHTAEIHPAWQIHARAPTLGPRHPAPLHRDQRLALAVRVPAAVPVGARLDVHTHARWVIHGRSRPASQVRLFTELTSAAGRGVRWKAAMTDTLGAATMPLVALDVPGPFTVTVYANASGHAAIARVSVLVKRR